MTTIYFPDTNFFLEFRKANELPWNELLVDCPETIELLIAAAVVTELDNHKRKGGGRKQRRAREVSAEIRKADLDPTGKHAVREKNPRVLQGSPPVLTVDYSQWPVLDRTNPDHQIVAQVATYVAEVGPACILTDDTNLAQIARAVGVPVLYLPDSWEMPPEPDAQAKTIAKLEAEVRQLKNARPEVDIQVLGPDQEAIVSGLSVPLKDYGRTEGLVDRVVAKVAALYPMETEFTQTREDESRRAPKIAGGLLDIASLNDLGMPWLPPSETDIKDYQETDYPGWLTKVRERVKQVATKLSIQARTYDFHYDIVNNGFANAEMVQLRVRAFDGLLLSRVPDEDDDEEDARLPQPPVPPKGRVGMIARMHTLDRMHRMFESQFEASQYGRVPNIPLLRPAPVARDPNSFYYKDNTHTGMHEELTLSCEALPHQVEPYTFTGQLCVPIGKSVPTSRLEIRLHASNLLRPVEKHVPLKIEVSNADLEAEIMDIILEELRG